MRGLYLGISLAAVTCFASPAFADDWAKKYSLSGPPQLRVETNDGHVTIDTWARNEISVTVTTVGWKIGPNDVRIEERQSGNLVDLSVKVPRQLWSWGINIHSLKIDVRMPQKGDVNVRTGDGHVNVSSFAGNTLIHTGDGHITLNAVQGTADLSTGDGHIQAHPFDGSLRASTGDGHIEVEGRFEALDLKTGDGRVNADVLPGSRMSSSWRIHTGDGSVTLRLPEKFSADLDAETRDGHINLDFPVTVSGKLSRSHVHGPLNGGGPTFRVTTGDGSIHIEHH